jgi:hypothetical protein
MLSPKEIVSCVPAGIVTGGGGGGATGAGAGCGVAAVEFGWEDELGVDEVEGEFEELLEGVEDLLHPPIESAKARQPAMRVIRMIGSCADVLCDRISVFSEVADILRRNAVSDNASPRRNLALRI